MIFLFVISWGKNWDPSKREKDKASKNLTRRFRFDLVSKGRVCIYVKIRAWLEIRDTRKEIAWERMRCPARIERKFINAENIEFVEKKEKNSIDNPKMRDITFRYKKFP